MSMWKTYDLTLEVKVEAVEAMEVGVSIGAVHGLRQVHMHGCWHVSGGILACSTFYLLLCVKAAPSRTPCVRQLLDMVVGEASRIGKRHHSLWRHSGCMQGKLQVP